mmetsp:Transcript_22893/g.42506  ORF Transcript_22893/g.42506 Transcript_22893/m.42506 type:complete len:103 (-) Transcript_22893:493-801(-)
MISLYSRCFSSTGWANGALVSALTKLALAVLLEVALAMVIQDKSLDCCCCRRQGGDVVRLGVQQEQTVINLRDVLLLLLHSCCPYNNHHFHRSSRNNLDGSS